MPSSNKFANVANLVLLSLAILCGLYCLFVVGAIYAQSDGEGFAIIDYMVAAEGEVPDPSASPGYYLSWVIALSLLGAAASILGCMGSCDRFESDQRQPCLSTFFCSMLALSVFFMIVYTSAVEFDGDMVPILTRQTNLMTDASVLPIFSARLGCPTTGPTSLPGQISAAELAGVPCGEDCQARTASIRQMANRTADGPDSCSFLAIMNQDYAYNSMGPGKCQVTPAAIPVPAPLYTSSIASLEFCKAACTAWSACAGVSFNAVTPSCLLVSSSDPDGDGTAYVHDSTSGQTSQIITPITGADAIESFECFAKSIPTVLQTMIDRNLGLSYLMIIGAVAALVTGLLCAVITFTVATKMQGKKGIHMVCLRMYCGCCFTPSDKVRVADVSQAGNAETDRLMNR